MLSQNCYDQFLPLRVQGGPHLVGIVSKLDGRLEDCSNSTHGPQVRVFFWVSQDLLYLCIFDPPVFA